MRDQAKFEILDGGNAWHSRRSRDYSILEGYWIDEDACYINLHHYRIYSTRPKGLPSSSHQLQLPEQLMTQRALLPVQGTARVSGVHLRCWLPIYAACHAT